MPSWSLSSFSGFMLAYRGPFLAGRICVATVALAVGLGACSATQETTIQRGYVLDQAALGRIKPGTDVQTVLQTLGTPSTVSTVGNKTFYYISQTLEQRFQFIEPSIVDQRVLAVSFNQGFKVEHIANYGLKDGIVFDFITRTTPTAGAEQSFVRQLFRGLGTFNPLGA